jgi:hypothetical protein
VGHLSRHVSKHSWAAQLHLHSKKAANCAENQCKKTVQELFSAFCRKFCTILCRIFCRTYTYAGLCTCFLPHATTQWGMAMGCSAALAPESSKQLSSRCTHMHFSSTLHMAGESTALTCCRMLGHAVECMFMGDAVAPVASTGTEMRGRGCAIASSECACCMGASLIVARAV